MRFGRQRKGVSAVRSKEQSINNQKHHNHTLARNFHVAIESLQQQQQSGDLLVFDFESHVNIEAKSATSR